MEEEWEMVRKRDGEERGREEERGFILSVTLPGVGSLGAAPDQCSVQIRDLFQYPENRVLALPTKR